MIESAQFTSMRCPNSTNLVVIATFNNSVEATLSQGLLKAQGIESWFQDEATVNLAWYLTIAVGGIKLFVRAEDEQLARTILDDYQAHLNQETSENNDLTPEMAEESHLQLISTDKILRRALRVAMLGLIFLPLQLYSNFHPLDGVSSFFPTGESPPSSLCYCPVDCHK